MNRVRWTFAIGLALATMGTSSAAAQTAGPEEVDGEYLGVSPAVSDLGPADGGTSSNPQPRQNPQAGQGAAADGDAADPLAGADRRAAGRTPAPDLTFEGQGNTCFCTPPDTTGDVGPNHYVQAVNANPIAIFNKNGTAAAPPFQLSDLFPAGACSTDDDGDPQVLYDSMADRWVLAQFNVATDDLCFAVSQTPDPTGAYFTYQFGTPTDFPDYFKVGVWPTGYYVSTNESTYTAYAFNRDAMLAGSPATGVRFPGQNNFLMPADVDGPHPPDPQGGLFYTFKDNAFHGGVDRLELFQLTPNFATPAASTFTTVATIPITSFTYTVCGFFVLDCIPQGGTTQKVDAVSEWPMQRLAYRNFPGHETLLGNFTVDVGSDRAGIRWFELRNTGSGYSLFQEGTHAPGSLHRFMGSIAMDGSGDIALGYTASSSSAFPSIRYATRVPTDPLGTLQTEQVMQAGGGSQTASSRWGDYSMMSIDPADDCTFWYTNEYYPASAGTAWHTRIGNFKEPTCAGPPPPPDRSLTVVAAGNGSGFVDSSPAGIDCGLNTPGIHTDCGELYAGGTVVTLTAHPDANTDFTGFSGAGCSGTGPCTVTMDAAKTVTATFAAKQRNLTVITSGTGAGVVDSSPAGIDCGLNQATGHVDCDQQYAHGTAVTLTAHPDAGNGFAGFSGGGCSGTGPCTVTMDADKTVTAKFDPSNDFSLGGIKRNTKKGTATLTVDVPGPGNLSLTGKQVKPQRPARAARRAAPKPVSGAGKVKLKVIPKGKAKKKLNRKGKAKVKVKITFTPTGGAPSSQTKTIKLKKKL